MPKTSTKKSSSHSFVKYTKSNKKIYRFREHSHRLHDDNLDSNESRK